MNELKLNDRRKTKTSETRKGYARDRMRKLRADRRRENTTPAPADLADPAAAVLSWCKSKLKVPPGHPNEGAPFEIPEYGAAFIREALAPDTTEALLCIARKNSKSGIIAALLLAFLVGPLKRSGWRAGVASINREKAAELRKQMETIAEASDLERITFYKTPIPGGRVESEYGASVDILSADKDSGAASGYDLAIIDELGLLEERSRELVASMRSSVSAKGGKFLALSIYGRGPFCGEIIDRREDPGVVVHLFQAPEGCALTDPDGWHAANPGLAAGIKSLAYMEAEARRVQSTAADEAAFRAHDLNRPGDPGVTAIVTVESWRGVCYKEQPPRKGPCVVGFDMGGSRSLTAAAVLWPENLRLECSGACGDNPDLVDRGKADGVGIRYQEMADRGELQVFPGRVTDAGAFFRWLAESLKGQQVQAVAADVFRQSEVMDAMTAAGLRWRVSWRRVGLGKDGSADVRAFQKMTWEQRLRPGRSLFLESSIRESMLRFDENGNPALDKRRQKGRIDALQAAVLAAGLAEKMKAAPPRGAGGGGVDLEDL